MEAVKTIRVRVPDPVPRPPLAISDNDPLFLWESRRERFLVLHEFGAEARTLGPAEGAPATLSRGGDRMNVYVLESGNFGWKVVVSEVPYCELHPSNFAVIADGLRWQEACELAKRMS